MQVLRSVIYSLIILVIGLSFPITVPSLLADGGRGDDTPHAALLSPDQVKVQVLSGEDYLAASQLLPSESSWVHGSSAHWEPLVNGITLSSFGYGSVVRVPATSAITSALGWVHLAVPTPVVSPQLQQAKLTRVLLSFDGDIGIDRIDIWDGPIQLAFVPLNQILTGDHLTGGNIVTISFPSPPTIGYGVGISARVRDVCNLEICSSRTLRIAAGGAGFER